MCKLSTPEVLRLRATSAVSPDLSVRRSAQDDGFVGGLEYNWLNLQKTQKSKKSQALRMTALSGAWIQLVEYAENPKIEKSQALRMTALSGA